MDVHSLSSYFQASRELERKIAEAKEVLPERLATLAHEQWSGWMQYLFSGSIENADGSATIPAWAVRRWQRQMTTPYAELSEGEKASDRAEAQRVIDILDELEL